MEHSVVVDAVSKSLGGQQVVRGVSLSVRTGEFFSLLGPSGCGKSTTLRLIAGFEKPNEGRILINGSLPNGTPAFVRDVNLVFQNYALFPHMTVWENVAFGLQMMKKPRSVIETDVARMLERVRLTGYEARYPGQLSGGQQQRVALARALVTEPSVVLLDEPLGALDLKLRKEMQFELKHLQRSLGHTFIYVTHDQEEALAMSDRIAVMHEGRVLQVGTPEEIYETPATRFVADFIGETNLLPARVTGQSGENMLVESGGLHFEAGRGTPGPPDEDVYLSIRPEKIRMGGTDSVAPNRFPGTVEHSAYFGSARLIHIRLTPATLVCLRQPNGEGPAPQPGERVHVDFPIEALSVLRAES
ncbi:MAG: ABC transporter ATP-binding protein [Opitutaceae bacterium]